MISYKDKFSTHHKGLGISLPVQCQCAVKMNSLHFFQLTDVICPVVLKEKNVISLHFQMNSNLTF